MKNPLIDFQLIIHEDNSGSILFTFTGESGETIEFVVTNKQTLFTLANCFMWSNDVFEVLETEGIEEALKFIDLLTSEPITDEDIENFLKD